MDQHVPASVTRGLRLRGVDVLTAQEASLCGNQDSELLEFAIIANRVLVTFDSDFLALHQSNKQHAGIAWCPEMKHGIGGLIGALQLIHSTLDMDQMRNHVEFL
jgi:hypothetical protein